VTVVDDSGYPVLVSRLDEATPAGVKTAIEKARSAVLYGIPTRVLEELVSERPALGGLDRVAVEGGLPILFCGQRAGGIGVSGVCSDQDAVIAQSALDAVHLDEP
jgi:glc operon protein GlcG